MPEKWGVSLQFKKGSNIKINNKQHLEERDDGLTYEADSDTPYTGGYEVISEEGVLEQTGSYKNGLLHGFRTDLYEDYSIELFAGYHEGAPDGTWTKFYESGQKELELSYNEGLLHGAFTRWYENGQKEREVQFRNDEEYGVALYWYENGNLSERITHRTDGGWSQMVWHEDGRKHFFCENPSEERETVLLREWGGDGKIETDEMW